MPDFEREKFVIPPEIVRERPKVFESKESWDAIRKFCLKYKDLRVESVPKDFTSIADFINRVEEGIEERVRETLPSILEGVKWKDPETRKGVIEAVAKREFQDIDVRDKEILMTTLGLGVVAERARTRSTAEILKSMKAKELGIFDMTPDQRDVVVEFLKTFAAADPEYVRFKSRAMTSEVYPKRPVDAVREGRRIALGIGRILESIEDKGAEDIFGRGGSAFVEYLKTLKNAYIPLKKEAQPYTEAWRKKKAKEVVEVFTKFVKENPDFPLIILPKMESYVETPEGVDLGFDPELRIFWQSKERRGESKRFVEVRDDFVEFLETQLGEKVKEGDLKNIRNIKPVVCDDVGSFGLNMQFRAEAQEIGTEAILLYKNIRDRDVVEPSRQTLLKIFGKDWQEIINSPKYSEFSNILVSLHEYGHSVYPEKGMASKNLGKRIEDGISEMKPDALARAALHNVLKESGEKHFGEKSKAAINLTIIGEALEYLRAIPPESDERPYYVSAVSILNELTEYGLWERDQEGNIKVDAEKLNQDLSKRLYIPHAKEILSIYQKAETGDLSEIRTAREEAERLAIPAVHPTVEAMREQIKS